MSRYTLPADANNPLPVFLNLHNLKLNPTTACDENLQNYDNTAVNRDEGKYSRVVRPPVTGNLVSMCNSITSETADLLAVDRIIKLLDNTVSEMIPETVLPEMKWMLLETILYVADSPEKFPLNVRQGMLEAALGCTVFRAQRAMIQNRLFATWDSACWEVEVAPSRVSLPRGVIDSAQSQCSYGVYETERLMGDPRTHTMKAFPNLIVDDTAGDILDDTNADMTTTSAADNIDFSRWWRNNAAETRRAFTMTNATGYLCHHHRVSLCHDDSLEGM